MVKADHISAAVMVLGTGLIAGGSASAQDGLWIVGQVAPLTGPAATVGVRAERAVQMWADEVNAQGGIKGRKVELITCNDENKAERAVACAREMIQEGAVLIIGNALTASLKAIQPLVKNGPTFLIGSPNVVPSADSYGFQVSPSDHEITEALAAYMNENKITKVGMMAATDASGEAGVASAQDVFPKYNIELKLERIDLKATDASTQLVSVANDDIPLVYSSYTGGGAVTVVKSFSNLGLEQPLVVSYGNISSSFAELVKSTKPARLLGTGLTSLVPDEIEDAGEKERATAFLNAYQQRYNEKADLLNVIGKMGADTAHAILSDSPDPTDFAATKRWLEETPVKSVHTISFSPTNHIGLSTDTVTILELTDNGWEAAGPLN